MNILFDEDDIHEVKEIVSTAICNGYLITDKTKSLISKLNFNNKWLEYLENASGEKLTE